MELKKQSVISNYLYQFIYQALVLVIPFVISPYLTRTLRETALGSYTYFNSIAYYFVIAANLGISVHGKRIISRCEKDETRLRKSFWSLFFLHSIISFLVTIIYIVIGVLFVKESKAIFLIETIYVLSALFDITWLFYGLENFSSVVIKNAITKVAECVLIFIFVKSPSDLWIYTLITASSSLIGQLIMIPQAIAVVHPIKFSFEDCKQHIKPLLVFSVALIASSIYTIFDKTLLGLLLTKESVAFYDYSNKIVAIPQTFVGVIGTVMFPKACKLAAEGKNDEQKKYIMISAIITAFIGMGSIFGLCAVAPLFARIYYGEPFAICGGIIMALSPTIYIVGAGSILRTQCLIPNGMDKEFNLCIVYNAIINLVLSTMLIPILGIYGAVIGTLSAELFGLVYQTILCKNLINLKEIYFTIFPFTLIGTVMFVIVKIVANFLYADFFSLILEVLVGGTVYCIGTLLYIVLLKKYFS